MVSQKKKWTKNEIEQTKKMNSIQKKKYRVLYRGM